MSLNGCEVLGRQVTLLTHSLGHGGMLLGQEETLIYDNALLQQHSSNYNTSSQLPKHVTEVRMC